MTTSVAGDVQPVFNVVQLDVPADPAYVAVVRTAAAGLAARADLTLDRIEDLRIAVDEACALLLTRPRAVDGEPVGVISCVFTLEDSALTVEVTGPVVTLPEPSAFAWAVLEALVDTVSSGHDHASDGSPSTWLRVSVRSGAGSWA
jgi:serine/threonine-protein kinase RsbW